MSAVHLFGDGDEEFQRGFQLGVVWQLLRQGLDRVDVVVPVGLVTKASRLAHAVGYRTAARRPPGLPGLRFLRFTSTRGAP